MQSRMIKLFTKVGKAVQAQEKKPTLFKSYQVPVVQTHGRHQYYRAEVQLFLPDSIKWGLRFPNRFPVAEPNIKYRDETEQQILGFLGDKFAFDISGSDEDLNLDMTLEEAEYLILASESIKEKGKSGELAALNKWMRDFYDKKQTLLVQMYDQLDRVMQQADAMEDEILEDLADESEELQNLRKSNSASLLDDLSGLNEASRSFENYILVQGYADKNPSASDIASKADTLNQLLAVRGAALRAKADVQGILVEKDTENDLSRSDYLETLKMAETYEQAFSSEDELSGEALTLMGQVDKTRTGDMSEVMNLLKEHDVKEKEMHETYANFIDFDSRSEVQNFDEDNFRTELLKWLSVKIFVKDHRYRYQKEQFDRYVASLQLTSMSKKTTLKEFADQYARLIDAQVLASHNFRSPKIDANYDDFQDKTLMPMNATVFYYFFSSNRQGKTFAQWMMSAVRYPNEKMRRSYMRFFA